MPSMLGSKLVINAVLSEKKRVNWGTQIRPTEEELKEMGPEFNVLWDKYFKDKPDKPVM